jgi:hypothetical protein
MLNVRIELTAFRLLFIILLICCLDYETNALPTELIEHHIWMTNHYIENTMRVTQVILMVLFHNNIFHPTTS